MSDVAGLWVGQLVAAGLGLFFFATMLLLRRLARQPDARLALLDALQFWGYLAIAELTVYRVAQSTNLMERVALPVFALCVGILVIRTPYLHAYRHLRGRVEA